MHGTMAQYVDGFAIALPKNKIATLSPEEEAEFEKVMIQARSDAFALGISQRFKDYLEHFPPKEQMQHVLAMFAELENQVELCQRLLCTESDAADAAQETQNQWENLSNNLSPAFLILARSSWVCESQL
jgi:hypothetical protein